VLYVVNGSASSIVVKGGITVSFDVTVVVGLAEVSSLTITATVVDIVSLAVTVADGSVVVSFNFLILMLMVHLLAILLLLL
jgi:hypothetical protein